MLNGVAVNETWMLGWAYSDWDCEAIGVIVVMPC